MEDTGEWHVVRHRKNIRRVSQTVSNGWTPRISNERSSSAIGKFVTLSTDLACPRAMEAIYEVLTKGFSDARWIPEDTATAALLAKCERATGKVCRSTFFQGFLEQLRQLHQLTTGIGFWSTGDGVPPVSDQKAGNLSPRRHWCNEVVNSESWIRKQHMQLVVYGIGSLEESEVSRCQLSLALLLKAALSSIVSVQVCDPVLTPREFLVLKNLGCTPLEHNEGGKMCFSVPTLFYMPHCEARLYDDVMMSNMHLVTSGRAVILGNSFRSYQNRWSLADLSRNSYRPDLLLKLAEIVDEHPVNTRAFPVQAAFNDTSWHFFPPFCGS